MKQGYLMSDQVFEIIDIALSSGFLEGTAVALGMPASVLVVLRILKNQRNK